MSTSETNDSKIKIKSSSRKKKKDINIYTKAIINRNVSIPIINVGKNLKETLTNNIVNNIEGKCISEGYIKIDSVAILSYSNGLVNGSNIIFQVILECLVCNPVEGMYITCIAKNITKAGIRAQISDTNNPMIIFIARDHNYMTKSLSVIQPDQVIKVRIIGKRFELNDKYISAIAELIQHKSSSKPPVSVSSKDDETSIIISPVENLETDIVENSKLHSKSNIKIS